MGNKEGKRIVTTFVSGTSSNVSELGGRLLHCVQWMDNGDNNSMIELKALLKKGAPVNIVSVDDMTALHIACKRGLLNVIDELLNHGADIQAHNTWLSDTPLHVAASTGNQEVVELLLKRGANPNALNSFGGTPLHSAAVGGFSDIVETLIQNGADLSVITYKDPFFCCFQPLRALAYAVRKGDVACIVSFLKNGDSFCDFEPRTLFLKLISRHVPWDLIELFVIGGLKLNSEILCLDENVPPPEFLWNLVTKPKPLEYCCLQKIRTLLRGKNWEEAIKELPISEFHKDLILFKDFEAKARNLYPI